MGTSSRSGSTTGSSRAAELWTLAAIVATAAALRLHGLSSVFPLDDEYFQFFYSVKPATLAAFLALIRENPHHLLLDPLSTWLVGRFATGMAAIRLPSALWGIALPYAVWRLARKALDRDTALFAALLSSIALLQLDWSRRADFYGLLPTLAALQAAAWLDLEEDPRHWKGFAFWTSVFSLSHPYGTVSPLMYGVLSYKRQGVRAAWLKSSVTAGFAFLPWFAFSTRALLDNKLFDFRGVPGQLTLPQFLLRAPLFLAHSPETGLGRTWSLGTGSALAAAYAGCFAFSFYRRGERPRLVRLCLWAAPLWVLAVASFDVRYRYYFTGRQQLVALPFYLIAVAHGAKLLLGRAKIPLSIAAAALLAAWLPLYMEATTAQTELEAGFQRLAAQIAASVRPGDSFTFAHDGLAMGFLYHYDRAAFLGADGFKIFGGYAGHLTYQLPRDLTARGVPVRVAPWDPDAPPDPAAWVFHGTMYDFYVEPPLRRAGGVARKGG